MAPKRKSSNSLPSSKKKIHNTGAVKKCAMLIDSGIIVVREPVRYLRRKDKFVMKEGEIMREGILCSCCSVLFTLSKFELHAGSALHRPSANMFLKDGRSLAECEEQAAKILTETSKNSGFPAHSDSTSSCISGIEFNNKEQEDSNNQLENKSSKLDDHRDVEASFDNDNLSISEPNEDIGHFPKSEDDSDTICEICGGGRQLIWCDSCLSAFHADCLHLDGLPEGVWHCPRCRCGFCGSGEDGVITGMLSCVQCRISYHRECLFLDSHVEIKDPWFCSKTCQAVFIKLRRSAGHVFPLENDLSCMMLSSFTETSDKSKLSAAHELLAESFDPIMDRETGIDLLSQVVFNSEACTGRLNYRGFHTMLLSKGQQLVSVAIIRIHGDMVAEMPFIGTSKEFRKLGMCKALMQALETLLRDILGVRMIVLSSVNELANIWINSFNFKPMSIEDRWQLSCVSLLSLARTKLLYKTLM